MSTHNPAITAADDQMLSALIRSARHRIVAMAPAFSKPVACAICECWGTVARDRVTVIVDVDPEVYRLGYGDFEALELLEKAASHYGTTLNRHERIRIGVLIVDDTTVVYSPTPRLIEAGPQKPTCPNAVILGPPPEDVARELGQGPSGLRDRTIGLDKAERARLQAVKESLGENPPQRFDISRTVRVFNAYFEFVDFELKGLQIHRHTASIPPDLMGLAKDERTQRQLRATFKLVEDTSNLSGKTFQDCKNRLIAEYLTLLPGYGYVVLRSVKPKFERKVAQLRRAVERFGKRIEKELEKAMTQSRAALVTALLPAVKQAPPKRWQKHFQGTPPDALAKRLLDDELRREFGTAERLVSDMKVKLVFKGVTYESLKDEEFAKLARDRLPGLDELYREFGAAEGQSDDTTDEE
jgi:hypothetical protein